MSSEICESRRSVSSWPAKALGRLVRGANVVLKPLGLALVRESKYAQEAGRWRDLKRAWPQFLSTIEEMEAAARELLFADLPRRAGRSEFMGYLQGTGKWEAFYLVAYLHRALAVP